MKPIQQKKRRGVVLVFVAISLVMLLGFVALAVDGGMLLLERREARATADAAAMAAACELYNYYPQYHGKDDNGQARQAALDVAAANGYANDGTTEVEIHIPPQSGPYAGLDGYAEVIVTKHVQRGFSRIFGSGTIAVRARSVSWGAWTYGGAGIIILDYDDKSSLNAQGNGAFTETGGTVIVNSNNPEALVTTGNGSMVAPRFHITGGTKVSSNANLTTSPVPNQVLTGVHPTPDPLAYLPPPEVPSDGTSTVTNLGGGKKKYVLTPGRHTNLPIFGPGDQVVLKQSSYNDSKGIYYIDGGGFKSTGANITLDSDSTGGILLYNKPNGNALSDKIQITGNASGEVNLAAVTDGPYAGIMIWQERSAVQDMLVEGNGKFSLKGTLYAAGAKLNVNGNGKTSGGEATGSYVDDNGQTVTGASQVGSQFVVKNLSLGGNGNVVLHYRPQGVGRVRIITLVE